MIGAITRIIWFLLNSHQNLRGKCTPHARIKQRKYRKSPEGLTKSVRFSGLFFLPGRCIQKSYTKQQKGDEQMVKRSVHYARGPPEWIRTDSLSWIKTEKVNQIWFTRIPRPNAPCMEQMSGIAQRIPAARENRRLGRFRGCVAARAVQLNTRE